MAALKRARPFCGGVAKLAFAAVCVALVRLWLQLRTPIRTAGLQHDSAQLLAGVQAGAAARPSATSARELGAGATFALGNRLAGTATLRGGLATYGSPIAPHASCAPPVLDPSIGAARRAVRPLVGACESLATDVALCTLGKQLARDGRLVLFVVSGIHARALELALLAAARALGASAPILVLSLDDAAEAVCARLGAASFRLADGAVPGGYARGARAAAAAAHALLSAGLVVLVSAGAPLLLAADPFGALASDADVEVLTEGWDEVTAGGHVHGFADEAMGWSGYSETLRIAYALPATLALWPTPNALELARRLAADARGLSDQSLSEQLWGAAYDGVLRGGAEARVLHPACFATADRALRGMAPRAVAVSAHGLAPLLRGVGLAAAALGGELPAEPRGEAGEGWAVDATVGAPPAVAAAFEALAAALATGRPLDRPTATAVVAAALAAAGGGGRPAAADALLPTPGVMPLQKNLRDDLIWAARMESADVAVRAQCGVAHAARNGSARPGGGRDGGGGRLTQLVPIVGEAEAFPAHCADAELAAAIGASAAGGGHWGEAQHGALQGEDGPGGLGAVCAVVRAGGAHPRSRDSLVAISNKNILPMLQQYLGALRAANVRHAIVVALDAQTAAFVRRTGGAHVYERQLQALGGSTGTHATSGLKFRVLVPFLKIGVNVLLSDVDVVYLRDPLATPRQADAAAGGGGGGGGAYLHRDADVEAMSDGWDDETAYGWHMRLDPPERRARGAALPSQPGKHMWRFGARNSGQFYVRATLPSLRLLRRMAGRMAAEHVWDQSAYNQEIHWPALPYARASGEKGEAAAAPAAGRVGTRVSVRVLNYACFCNSKWLFRYLLARPADARWAAHRPVSVHINYHPEKAQRMASIIEHYAAVDAGAPAAEPSALLRAWSGVEGSRATCEDGGDARPAEAASADGALAAELIELSSKGPFVFNNLPAAGSGGSGVDARLLGVGVGGDRRAFGAVRFLAGGDLVVEPPAAEPRARANAPEAVRARVPALRAPARGGWWRAVSASSVEARILGETYRLLRRKRALIGTRCAAGQLGGGVEIFGRYEGSLCGNTTAWRPLAAGGEAASAAARAVLADGGHWSWQGTDGFVFGPAGELTTPWGRGEWGLVPGQPAESALYARFVDLDHLLVVSGDAPTSTMTSMRCADGDKATLARRRARARRR